MKSFTSSLIDCTEDKYFRFDEKYHIVLKENLYNVFNVDNTIKLSEILIEDYCNFEFQDDKEYRGIPTGQEYIDEDGYIIDNHSVTKDNHPDRLKYKINSENILLSSLRLAKTPALNFHNDNVSDCVFSNGFYIFKTRKDWNKKFVLYVLRHPKIKNLLDNHLYRGIGISAYKVEDLYKCNIKAITPNQQKEAASLIEPIEQNIFSLKSTIKPAQQIIDEVFQKEFHFDYDKFEELKKISRFDTAMSDFSNNPDLRFSAKFHRPVGEFVKQELVKITDKKIKHFLAEPIVLGASVSPSDYDENGEYHYLSMATIKDWDYNNEEAQLVSDTYALSKADKTICKNDIILARSGEGTIGKVALIEDEDVKAVFADFTMRIRLKNYNQKFAYYYMRSMYFQYLVEVYKKGLGNNTNIFPIVIREFPLPDISLDAQQRFVDKIQSEIDKQTEIKSQIADYRNKIDDIIEKTIKEG